MPQVQVTINGRAYRMACDEGEQDRLMGLARRFDEAISTLRREFGEIGDLRLTVMAGIMVTDRLAEAERRLAEAGVSGDAPAPTADGQIEKRLVAAAERLEALATEISERNRD